MAETAAPQEASSLDLTEDEGVVLRNVINAALIEIYGCEQAYAVVAAPANREGQAIHIISNVQFDRTSALFKAAAGITEAPPDSIIPKAN